MHPSLILTDLYNSGGHVDLLVGEAVRPEAGLRLPLDAAFHRRCAATKKISYDPITASDVST